MFQSIMANVIYKSTISCYYFAQVGRLRVRIVSSNTLRKPAPLTWQTQIVDTPSSSTERRHSKRHQARCEAELTAELSILDTDAAADSRTLVYTGEMYDLSEDGLGLVLPSSQIDARYCDDSRRVKLSLHLPGEAVALEISPVRCVPLNPADIGRGYFIGAKIVGVTAHKKEFERYLQSFSSATLES
jgi:hypothetical protein